MNALGGSCGCENLTLFMNFTFLKGNFEKMTENSNYLYAHCMYNVKIPLAVQQLQKTEWANDISMNASSGAAPLVLNQF